MKRSLSIVGWALLGIATACTCTAAVLLDPALAIGVERTNQNIRLNWFGSNGIPYQVESSTNFAWTNASGVITGAGANLSFTAPMSTPGQGFFRIRNIALPVITASFSSPTGILTVIGDDFDNTITVGRTVGGILTVNGGAVPITGGIATTANTILIEVFGRGGNDPLTMDESGGAMPAARLHGEGGDDTLTGSAAVDDLHGGPGIDTLVGRGGSDSLFGNDDDDILFWSAGDGDDVVEGGAGHDRLVFNGNSTVETLTFSANGTRLRATRDFDSSVSTLDVNGVERVDCHPLQGADTVVISNLVATAVTQLNLNLAAFLSGTNGDANADTVLLAGPTNANVINVSANAGAVEASGLGALVRVLNGELFFDSLDIPGMGGDVLNVNGSDRDDTMSVTANGLEARVDVTGFTVPLNVSGALSLIVNGLGGADTFSCVGNLAALVPITLDGGADNDTIRGSNGADLLLGGAGEDFIDGQQGNDVAFGGGDNDTFQWDPGDGSDTLEGQEGNDTLLFNGSAGAEIMEASANGSRLRFTRNLGNIVMDIDGVELLDVNALGGADVILANNVAGTGLVEMTVDLAGPGDVSDGQPDVVTLNSTAASETFSFSASSNAVLAAGPGMQLRVVGGSLSNDFLSVVGVGNDVVNVNGSAAADVISVAANGTNASVFPDGFSIPVFVRGALTLQVNGLEGPDQISCVGNLAALVPIVLDGGEGNDTILGSNGADVLLGGAGEDFIDGQQGNDVAFGGGDNDTFQWDPGDGSDTLEGQDGTDTLRFNGSAGAEIMEASANGSRLRFTRNLGNIVMDIDGVELLDVNALGGADSVIVNSLAGTAATEVNLKLAGTLGGGSGDAQIDVITVNGSAAGDTFSVTASLGRVSVSGITPLITISNPEIANDSLVLNGLGGVDLFNVSPGATSLISVTTHQ